MSPGPWIGLGLWALATLATGERLMAWGGPRAPLPGIYRVSLWLAVGTVAQGVLAFWLSLLGLPLDPWVAWGLGLPFVVVALRARRRSGWRLPQRRGWPPPGWLALTLGACLSLSLARILWEPLTGWDARTLWSPFELILIHEKSVQAEGFTEPTRQILHSNYPLLLPLSRWALASWSGGFEDRVTWTICWVWHLATLGIVQGALARRTSPTLTRLLTATLAGIPFFYLARDGSLFSGYAEPLLTLLAASLGAAAMERLAQEEHPDPGWLRLATCSGVGLIFTKRGGLLLALLLLAGLALLTRSQGRWKGPALALALTALLSTPWWIHQRAVTHAPVQNYLSRTLSVAATTPPTRAPALLVHALEESFLRPGRWALLWWAFAAGLGLWVRGPRTPAGTLLSLATLLYAGLVWVFLFRSGIRPQEMAEPMWSRYLLPASPWAVLFLGEVLAPRPSGTDPEASA